jgi:hypothetical protein
MSCPTETELVEARIDEVLTRYRESPKFLFMLRTYLGLAAQAHLQVCDLPSFFDIDNAVGDQLTLIGKRLGWPRCHCVCDVQPVFGFECPEEITLRPVSGFGGSCDPSAEDVTWEDCASGLSEICLVDDEVYRSFLRVRRYQFNRQYDLKSLETCLEEFFGPQATVLYSGQGRIVIAPGRDLTTGEILLLQLYPRVLPIALGIKVLFHFGETRVFGFGEGWGGFCEDRLDLTQAHPAYARTNKVFGFCEGWGGFCEGWLMEGLPIVTENGTPILDETGQMLYTGPLTEHAMWLCREGAPWMCEVDVHPYDC